MDLNLTSLGASKGPDRAHSPQPGEKTGSGTFCCEVTDFPGDATVKVTTGTFTNLSYR